VVAGRIFGLDPSYFDLSFMQRDTIPEIQKMLGTGHPSRSSSKFPPVLFTKQEMDPTMATVFGNWEPLAKVIGHFVTASQICSYVLLHLGHQSSHAWKELARHSRVATCQVQRSEMGHNIIYPWSPCMGLGRSEFVLVSQELSLMISQLIFILSQDTSFSKDGVGAKSRLPYVAMFTAYKQLWTTLWEEPRIRSIRQKIDSHVWQSSSTSGTAQVEDDVEDFTSDLMRLALTNAGRTESDFLTTNNTPVLTLLPPTITCAVPVILPTTNTLLPTIETVLPTTENLFPAPMTCPLVIPTVAPVAEVASHAGQLPVPAIATGASLVATDVPATGATDSTAATLSPTISTTLPGTGSSTGQQGQKNRAGMLAPVSVTVMSASPVDATVQQTGRATRSRRKNQKTT
jgi:hypothetical protein